MLTRLIIAWVGNLIDTVATMYLYSKGDWYEVNPFSRMLLQNPLLFAVVKLAVMTIAVSFIWQKPEWCVSKFFSWFLCIEYLLVALYYIYTFIWVVSTI